MANATERRVEKLEAKTLRQAATIDKLKERIAAGKAKRAEARAAKATPRAAVARTPKRRKAPRTAQASASA